MRDKTKEGVLRYDREFEFFSVWAQECGHVAKEGRVCDRGWS